MKILVHDGSPGPGGALTGLVALLHVLDGEGHFGHVVVEDDCASRFLKARLSEAGLEARFNVLDGAGGHLASGRAGYAARESRRLVRLRRLMAGGGYDVVIGNNAPGTNLSAAVASGSTPYAQYVRGPISRSRSVWLALRHASAVWAVGPDVAKTVVASGGSVDLVLDEGLAPFQTPTPRRSDASGILWAAAWMSWKGPDLMLNAWKRAHSRDELTMLTVEAGERVADPPPHHGLDFRVGAPLDSVRATKSVFVHTSLLPEPFGRTILEAMWAGLCPIVPDGGSGPRLVEHGRTGLIYETGSVESLARTLERVRRSPSLVRELGWSASLEARRYTADAIYAPIVPELERLANSHSKWMPRIAS